MTHTTNTPETVHPFEAAGLGKAPFRFIGMIRQDIHETADGGEEVRVEIDGITFSTKPGGSCAYCGTYIKNMYEIESADRIRFHVGCDCVHKTTPAKSELAVAVKAAEKEHTKALATARKAKRNAAREAARKAEREARRAAAEDTHGELLQLLDWAGTTQPAFAEMAESLRSGEVASLTQRQLDWLGAYSEAKRQESRPRKPSTHTGEVGKRAEFRLVLEKVLVFGEYSPFGPTYLSIFSDSEDRKLVWKSSTRPHFTGGKLVECDTCVLVKATVKAHSEYQGTKQTELTRCKVLGTCGFDSENRAA